MPVEFNLMPALQQLLPSNWPWACSHCTGLLTLYAYAYNHEHMECCRKFKDTSVQNDACKLQVERSSSSSTHGIACLVQSSCYRELLHVRSGWGAGVARMT